MDLGFCFQDLGDGGDSFVKSFIEPSGHAYQDAMLEDLASSSAPHGLGDSGGWDDSLSFVQPSFTGANNRISSTYYPQQPPSSSSSSPSGRASPASSLMTFSDYEDGSLLGGGLASGLAMAMPPLSLAHFDLQAGSMEMPDGLGLYGLSNFDFMPHPLERGRPSSSQHQHYSHQQQQQQHLLSPVKLEHPPAYSPLAKGASTAGAVHMSPSMWPSHQQHLHDEGEPLKRKRKQSSGAGARRGAPATSSSLADMPVLAGAKPKPSTPLTGGGSNAFDLPLAMDLAGGLVVGGASLKLEDRPEGKRSQLLSAPSSCSSSPRASQLQQQQQQQSNGTAEATLRVELVVERQPPVEVRTRTPSENRNFGVTVRIVGHHEALRIHSLEVRLAYASSPEEVNQQILGGKKTVPVKEDGRAIFDNLSMREASTKHGEREFCLEFVPLTHENQPLACSFGTRTSPFYAFSHMKVLARRKSVKLRTLNKSHGSVLGGDKMHVIGQPFIKGPSLSIIFSTPHGDITALNLEMYSDSVLFFEAPPYPCPAIFSPYSRDPVREVKVLVQVTNDGRTMSNPLEFTYIADKPVHRADF